MRSHPEAGEYAPFYDRYVQRVKDDPVDAMTTQLEVTTSLLTPLSEARALHRYAPEKGV